MQTNFDVGAPPAAVDITSYSSCKPDAAPRRNRKLPERILAAAHQACDLGDLDVAAQLLMTLESVIIQKRPEAEPQHRRTMESVIAAHHRLWQLRFNDTAASEPIGQMPSFHGDDVVEPSGR